MRILKKIKHLVTSSKSKVPEEHHNGKNIHLPTERINANALRVIRRLQQVGFEAYLVGGGVRDLLLNKEPKDFDVATSAKPEEVKQCFRNCRIIGRRFRLAHVFFQQEIIEVSTFRRHVEADTEYDETGMVLSDNTYGTVEEDAERRDFTINALYYDPEHDLVIDRTQGLVDLNKKIIRIIGDPEKRYREDPVRMIRAVRFAAKLEFNIEDKTRAPFRELHHLLWNVSSARLFEEFQKLFFTGHAYSAYQELIKYEFFDVIFPLLADYQKQPLYQYLIKTILDKTDERIQLGKTVNPAFLLAAMLWAPLLDEIKEQTKKYPHPFVARGHAMQRVLTRQLKTLSIPKRLTQMMKEIWDLQFRLARREGQRAYRLLEHPRFRAGYDFLVLRAGHEPNEKSLAEWWTTFQSANREERQEMTHQLSASRHRPRKTNTIE